MSGYKNSPFDTQEEYQAYIAYACHVGRDESTDDFWDLPWGELHAGERAAWHRAAAAVRNDTRSKPRF